MTRSFARIGAVLLIAGSAAIFTACASTPSADPSNAQTGDVPAPTSPAPTAGPGASPTPDPDCTTIIPASVVAEFQKVGWSFKSEALRVDGVEITGGIQCTWGDYTTATDHVQIFGWAPITPTAATTAQTDLIAAGWKREDAPAGVYLTENASTAIATDDQGYGLTYLFGDGFVKYADTKQGLLLVQWPPAG
ncbi:hypothetical protein [Microbacterium rhizomatis]|uniref:Nitrate ABC transporter substrate-binding protein n=1 Tax=Microbacterium rhizomatis TaxID=1631477 RepID=A0A5J5J364_9MICO|nr:hypothetical protein [Microbacterium rhizomatis]KAA9110657.1 hypothetical protein F6B43_03095 [Microbacterium rhizomatis]